MKKNSLVVTLVVSFLVIPIRNPSVGGQSRSEVASVYTGLSAAACTLKRVDREGGVSTQQCPGVSGYRILLLDSDNRMSVTVLTPDKQQHPLDFWRVVSPQFSSVSGHVEWRVKGKDKAVIPIALIVPFDVNDDPDSAKPTRYFVVVRLAGSICVVGKIKGIPGAISQARQEADAASERPCLDK